MYKMNVILVIITFFTVYNSNAFEDSLTRMRNDSAVTNYDEDISLNRIRLNNYKDIQLEFYFGKIFNESKVLSLNNSEKILEIQNFKKENPIVFYIHGYLENGQSKSVQVVIGEYLKSQPNTNIVLIDWSNMALGSYYLNAAPNTRIVAEKVANELIKLINLGLPYENIHLVGYCLGGQIAGFVGKKMKGQNIQLKRITALDPANLMFYPALPYYHISEDDAEFVDIIHTNAGFMGAEVSTGSHDFWVNLGTQQPGCGLILHFPSTWNESCSHARSWEYWAESISNPKAFPAMKADDVWEYIAKVTLGLQKQIVYMGVNASKSATGNYFLRTNNYSPYGLEHL